MRASDTVLVALFPLLWVAAETEARAEVPAKAPYPVSARLLFESDPRAICPVCEADSLLGPSLASCKAGVELTRRAFEAVLSRMFADRSPRAPALEIAVSLQDADVVMVAFGRRVVIEARIAVRSTGAGVIDTLHAGGEVDVLGAQSEAIPADAMSAAAEKAARDFERSFRRSSAIRNWLSAKGLNPVGPTSPPSRARRVSFLDVGGGPVSGSGDGAVAGGFLARFGVAGDTFFAQGILGTWASSFWTTPADDPTPEHYRAVLRAFDCGAEVGVLRRLGEPYEVRVGAGVHVLGGIADGSGFHELAYGQAAGRLAPAFSAALQAAWPTRAVTIRLGLEVRGYVHTTVAFAALSRAVPIAEWYGGGFLGFELPWAPTAPRAR